MPLFQISNQRTWKRILFQCVHKQGEAAATVSDAQPDRPTSKDLVSEPSHEGEETKQRQITILYVQSSALGGRGEDGHSSISPLLVGLVTFTDWLTRLAVSLPVYIVYHIGRSSSSSTARWLISSSRTTVSCDLQYSNKEGVRTEAVRGLWFRSSLSHFWKCRFFDLAKTVFAKALFIMWPKTLHFPFAREKKEKKKRRNELTDLVYFVFKRSDFFSPVFQIRKLVDLGWWWISCQPNLYWCDQIMNPTDDNDVGFFLFCVLIYFVASRLPSYFDATAIQAKIG